MVATSLLVISTQLRTRLFYLGYVTDLRSHQCQTPELPIFSNSTQLCIIIIIIIIIPYKFVRTHTHFMKYVLSASVGFRLHFLHLADRTADPCSSSAAGFGSLNVGRKTGR